MTAGRSAVFTDPAGATLCLWQAGENPGAGVVNEPGAMTWTDLVTADADADAAGTFYAGLFGWEFEEVEGGRGYRVIRNHGRPNGGIMPLPPEQAGSTPPHWMPYFGHRDVDALARDIGGLGGQVHQEPFDVLAGRIAVLGDPQGAVFAVWTGPYDED